jgi:DNA polymerase-3 subunit beta
MNHTDSDILNISPVQEGKTVKPLAVVARAELVGALKRVTPAVANDRLIPVLSGIRIGTNQNQLELTASNSDLTIHTKIPAVAAGGSLAVVPGALFAKFVERAGPEITISADGDDIVISSDGVLRVRTYNPEDWPNVPPASGTRVEFDARTLNAFRLIAHAASRDNTRSPILQGIRIQSTGWVAATDSHRLAAHRIPEGLPNTVLPASFLTGVLPHVKTCAVEIDDIRATLSTDTTSWTIRQIAGNYPAWEGLLTDTDQRIVFDRETMLGALNRLDILVDSNVPVVKAEAASDGLRLSIRTDLGDMEQIIEAKSDYAGTFGLNPRFLNAALNVITDEQVTIEIVDNMKPMMIRSGDLTQLIMPIRFAA